MNVTDNTVLRIGDWRVDPPQDKISKDGNTVKLERRAMQLLLCLAETAGQVVSVEQLLDRVWAEVVVTPDSVYHAVASLRRLLGDNSKEPTYIENVPRRGYRLVAAVQPWVDTPPATLDRRTSPPAEPAHASRAEARTGRRIAVVSSVLLLFVGLGYLLVDKFWLSKEVMAPPALSVATPPVTGNSIVVLPFVDMSEKKDQEYFSDGLSEELIDLLAKAPNLRVPASTSSFYFKGQHATVAQIAQALKVSHVLEGSVRKAGNTIRVTAQLIEAENGYHLWSETYDRELKDIFKVQDEIAFAVVSALKLKLAPGQNSHRTSIPEAYNQYLLGRQFYDRNNAEGFRRAVGAFSKAVSLDPSYGAPYAELAMSEYANAAAVDAPGLQRLLAEAEKAVALAPNDAGVYSVRGLLRTRINWDWSGAQADLQKALALDPGSSTVQRRYGDLLECLGRNSEAIAAMRRAIDIDPLSSTEWYILGDALTAGGQYSAAHEAFRRALEIQPESARARDALGTLQLLEGKPADALATFRQNGEGEEGGFAMAEYSLGHATESQQALDEFITKYAREAPYQVAQVYAWRGEKAKAFEWLERAYTQHDTWLAEIKGDLLLRSLRGEERFTAMLRKLQLPE